VKTELIFYAVEKAKTRRQQTTQSAAEICNLSAAKSLNMQLKASFDSMTFDLKT